MHKRMVTHRTGQGHRNKGQRQGAGSSPELGQGAAPCPSPSPSPGRVPAVGCSEASGSRNLVPSSTPWLTTGWACPWQLCCSSWPGSASWVLTPGHCTPKLPPGSSAAPLGAHHNPRAWLCPSTDLPTHWAGLGWLLQLLGAFTGKNNPKAGTHEHPVSPPTWVTFPF